MTTLRLEHAISDFEPALAGRPRVRIVETVETETYPATDGTGALLQPAARAAPERIDLIDSLPRTGIGRSPCR